MANKREQASIGLINKIGASEVLMGKRSTDTARSWNAITENMHWEQLHNLANCWVERSNPRR